MNILSYVRVIPQESCYKLYGKSAKDHPSYNLAALVLWPLIIGELYSILISSVLAYRLLFLRKYPSGILDKCQMFSCRVAWNVMWKARIYIEYHPMERIVNTAKKTVLCFLSELKFKSHRKNRFWKFLKTVSILDFGRPFKAKTTFDMSQGRSHKGHILCHFCFQSVRPNLTEFCQFPNFD